jgi:nicotinamide mononucleotide transporter
MIGMILALFEKKMNWIFGIANAICFFIIFYDAALYSDMFLQVYFFVTYIYGWIFWSNVEQKNTKIFEMSSDRLIKTVVASIIVIVVLSNFMNKINLILPNVFKKPMSYPYLDTSIAVFSIVGNWLLAKKIIQNWYFWTIVNILATYVYYKKELYLISLEYFVFLVFATLGYYFWRKNIKSVKLA